MRILPYLRTGALCALLAPGFALAADKPVVNEKFSDLEPAIQMLRQEVGKDRREIDKANMLLTNSEAARFWPIYDNYQRAADAATRRRTVALESIVSMDKPLTDAYAKNLANELIAADEAEVKARRALSSRLLRGIPTRVLPPRKAARYLQLEYKIRALQAYDIASGIPLVK